MTIIAQKIRPGWVLVEYRCCDLIWQVILHKNYPERALWFPKCTCGKVGWNIGGR